MSIISSAGGFSLMVQDASAFAYAPSRVELTAIAGLDLLMRLMRQLGIPSAIRRHVRVKKTRFGFTEDQYLIPLALNIALGRSDLNDIQWLARERKLLSPESALAGLPGFIPLDVDPSIFEPFAPKREGAETTCDGRLCYTPAFAFLGRERYLLHHQLQTGREKVVETIGAFLNACFAKRPVGIERQDILARFDAGLYSNRTITSCERAGVHY